MLLQAPNGALSPHTCEWTIPAAPLLAKCSRSAGISTLGWWLGLASVTNFIAAMIAGIAVLNNPDYVIQKWHIWLIFVVVTWMAIGLNVFGTRWLPIWNQFIRPSFQIKSVRQALTCQPVYFSATTLVVTMITILTCAAPNFQSAKFVFSDTTNSTGWSNDGIAFLLCIVNALYGFLGQSTWRRCQSWSTNTSQVSIAALTFAKVSTLRNLSQLAQNLSPRLSRYSSWRLTA